MDVNAAAQQLTQTATNNAAPIWIVNILLTIIGGLFIYLIKKSDSKYNMIIGIVQELKTDSVVRKSHCVDTHNEIEKDLKAIKSDVEVLQSAVASNTSDIKVQAEQISTLKTKSK